MKHFQVEDMREKSMSTNISIGTNEVIMKHDEVQSSKERNYE